ncbi:armadillo-type protein [Syncephalis plumigaleata]|nr:armadillo-type protein [Syncephalis plumigaleata]
MTLLPMSSQKLTFNESLVKGNRVVALGDLLKRLKQLHEELAGFEQEAVDIDSLSRVTREILSPLLFHHKDRGVRAYTACCIADLLRLYAPDAPYVEQELKEVFTLFHKQLEHISEGQSGYYNLYLYLLESLATVKSVAIVADLQDSDDIIIKFFDCFFKTIKLDTPQTVRICMVDVLGQLIEENSTLPQDAIDILLGQFLRHNRSTNPSAYQMAGELCNNNVDRLQRYICQYFTDVLLATNKSNVLTDTEKQNIKGAHQLIVELYRVAPGLLLNVIPQLEEELSLSNTYLRMLAASSLGELFSARESSLVEAYPSTWKTWLSRKNDKSAMVRAAWTEYLAKLYTNHPELVSDLNESAQAKLLDPEEKVRAAACQAIGTLDIDVILHHVDVEVLKQLGHRCRDKKIAPRVEALKALGRMYKLTYSRREDERVKTKIGWIPSEFLNILYSNDNEMIATMEAFFMRDILPLDENEEERTRRLIYVANDLDVKAQKALLALLQRKAASMKEMQSFIDYCRAYNTQTDETTESEGNRLILSIAARLPNTDQAVASLNKFNQLNDDRAVSALEGCMDPSASFTAIQRHKRDARKRIEHASSDMSDTFTVYDIIHYSMIPHLIQYGWTTEHVDDNVLTCKTARYLLKILVQVFPFLLRDYVSELVQVTISSDDDAVLDGLDTLSTCSVAYPDMVTLELYVPDKCRQGNRSAMLLAHQSNEETKLLLVDFVKDIALQSTVMDYTTLVPKLSALRTLAFYAPLAFESTIKEIILCKGTVANAESTLQEDWMEFSELDSLTQCKILGMKVLVNRLRGLVNDDVVEDLAQPVFKLLLSMLSSDDEQNKSDEAEASSHRKKGSIDHNKTTICQAWMRLMAGKLLLKLCCYERYDAMLLNNEFRQLALILEDHSPYVRESIANKLLKYLRNRQLHVRFMSCLLLMANEPDKGLRQQVKSYFRQQLALLATVSQGKLSLFELTISRFIHLLAHHPEFSTDTDDLIHFSKYLDFFLECCVSPANISLISIFSIDDTRSMQCTQWALTTYPNPVSLPRDLYRRLSTSLVAENLRKNHLPDEYMQIRKLPHRHAMTTPVKRAIDHTNQRTTHDHTTTRSDKAIIDKRRRIMDVDITPLRRNAPRAARANNKQLLADDDDDDDDDDENNHRMQIN